VVCPTAITETVPSILRFATIQRVEGKQGLSDLSPEKSFITTESIEDEARQIGEPEKGERKVGGWIGRFRSGARNIRFDGRSI
jgi:hypothetical protein